MTKSIRTQHIVEPTTGVNKLWSCVSDFEKYTEKLADPDFIRYVETSMRNSGKSKEDFIQTIRDEVWVANDVLSFYSTPLATRKQKPIKLKLTPTGVIPVTLPLDSFYDEKTQTSLTERVVTHLGVEEFKTYNRELMRTVTGSRPSFWKKAGDKKFKSGRKGLAWANPDLRAQIALSDYLISYRNYDYHRAILISNTCQQALQLAKHGDLD